MGSCQYGLEPEEISFLKTMLKIRHIPKDELAHISILLYEWDEDKEQNTERMYIQTDTNL